METVHATARLLNTELFWINFAQTMRAFSLALAIAIGGGISLALWLGFSRASGELFVPMLIGFASIPKVLLSPLVLLVFGLGVSARQGRRSVQCSACRRSRCPPSARSPRSGLLLDSSSAVRCVSTRWR